MRGAHEVAADALERGAVPGLDDALAFRPLEPLGQMGVGDDPPAAGQRLVPLRAVQGDGTDAFGDGRLLVAYHPQVLDVGPARGQFAVDGARGVGELAAVEAGVEDGGPQFVRRTGPERGVPFALDPLPVRAAHRHRQGAAGLQGEAVVVASLEREVPPQERLLPGEGVVQGRAEPERPVRLRVPLPRHAQVRVPPAFGQRHGAADAADGGGVEHGTEAAVVRTLQGHDGLFLVAAVAQDEFVGGDGGFGEGSGEGEFTRIRPVGGGDDGLDGPVGEDEVAGGVGACAQLPAARQRIAPVGRVGAGCHRQQPRLRHKLDAPDVVPTAEGAERDVGRTGA